MAKKSVKKIAAAGADQYMLRLPAGMRDAVAQLADGNGRSINTEIIAAIEQHLKGPDRLSSIEAFIEKYRRTIERVHTLIDWVEEDLWNDVNQLKKDVRAIDPRP